MESMPGTAIIGPVIGHTITITRVPTVSIDRITTGIIPLDIIALTEFIVGAVGKYLASFMVPQGLGESRGRPYSPNGFATSLLAKALSTPPTTVR